MTVEGKANKPLFGLVQKFGIGRKDNGVEQPETIDEKLQRLKGKSELNQPIKNPNLAKQVREALSLPPEINYNQDATLGVSYIIHTADGGVTFILKECVSVEDKFDPDPKSSFKQISVRLALGRHEIDNFTVIDNKEIPTQTEGYKIPDSNVRLGLVNTFLDAVLPPKP